MREIPLSRGFVAIVDDADYGAVMAAGPWHAIPHGRTVYAAHSRTDRPKLWLHHLITGRESVDHANGDGLDNRRRNLRQATQAQNCANRRIRSDNRSGYRGVHRAADGAWIAQIGFRGDNHYLGRHATAEAAALAYDVAALQFYGEFARPNFTEENIA